jgi:hypothetical protein
MSILTIYIIIAFSFAVTIHFRIWREVLITTEMYLKKHKQTNMQVNSPVAIIALLVVSTIFFPILLPLMMFNREDLIKSLSISLIKRLLEKIS